VGPQPAQAPPRCIKCNSPPINGQCTNHRMVYNGPLLCVGIKVLTVTASVTVTLFFLAMNVFVVLLTLQSKTAKK